MKIVVKTLYGLEEVLEKEMQDLGMKNIVKMNRAVGCEGDIHDIYNLNYNLRTGLRVLKTIYEGKIHNNQGLYDSFQKINWQKHFELFNSFSIDCTAHSEFFTHSLYASQVAKDSIVDQFRHKYRRRPDVDTKDPDIKINLFIKDRNITVSMDSSGGALFKRNYRKNNTEAPINEVLAAGLIKLANWDQKTNFIDPMCGSGTLPIEAYMLANNIPAQINRRKFCFMNWIGFEGRDWLKVKRESDAKISNKDIKIFGSDINDQNIRKAKSNFEQIKPKGKIKFFEKDFFLTSNPDGEPAFVMINPPYDLRLEEDDIIEFYKKMGDQLKTHYKNSTAWILSGNTDIKHLGLKPDQKINMLNGPIEAKFIKFELYEGSKEK